MSTEKYKAIYSQSKCINNFWGRVLQRTMFLDFAERNFHYPEQKNVFNLLTVDKFTVVLYLVVPSMLC